MIGLGFEDYKQSLLPILKVKLAEPAAGELNAVVEAVVTKYQLVLEFNDEMKEKLIENLRTSFNTTVSLPSVLRGSGYHLSWLNSVKENKDLKHWNRYKYYLRSMKMWPELVIDSLDETSDEILDLCGDPTSGEPFDRRGLVMGYVQSGKTANFTGVINKAFDVGYQVVIVLAGLHNNLRSQTQIRLDEEVIGFTMKRQQVRDRFVGVGLLNGYQFTDVKSLTNSDNNGDFSISKAGSMFSPPILLVVKKNKTVLTNLLNYLQKKSPYAVKKEGVAHKVVKELPLLIIDDEADQATVNTTDIYEDNDNTIINPEYDPSTINKLIRDIFHTFEKRSYVGYTATPFANMFIDRDSQSKDHGDDLFPRDFIYGLPKPNSYAGPAEYFNVYDNEEEQQGALVRTVIHEEDFVPIKHKKDRIPGDIPISLIESIYAYLIGTALRRLRGQEKKHSSMLVHVTRYTEVQNRVYRKINDYVESIKDAIRYARGNSEQERDMQSLYESDFMTTSNSRPDGGEMFNWEAVKKEIPNVLLKLRVKEINGKSSDVLEYEEHKDGHYVLAIGGDKLSRGLTLDGLIVSYYLRTTDKYDTLMQMGRWFGYREGYFDLCRIYTTSELSDWFYHIAVATEELRGQLEDMSETGQTPEQYALEISVHPDMDITSPNKMRTGRVRHTSYSASLVQTTVFENKKEAFRSNFVATENLIKRLGGLGESTTKGSNDNIYWENVKSTFILSFLEQYHTPSFISRVDTRSLKQYIESCNELNELKNWTVVIINPGQESARKIDDVKLNSGVKRKGQTNYDMSSQSLSIKILTSEGHEYADFSAEEQKEAKAIVDHVEEGNKKKHKANLHAKARSIRKETNGLLLLYPIETKSASTYDEGVMAKAAKYLGLTENDLPIGFAISFPRSKIAHSTRAVLVNKSIIGE
ncbi:Z1 domain-containing protein [Paenibacillus luteus]|uniref:Z1 domain-containing protein n=1 Tax=Paenibacillus luteus TaxID=2545753 RepID=UPI0011415FF4|nr:Z1 domain-containing protein [Paenibacillus luteus]